MTQKSYLQLICQHLAAQVKSRESLCELIKKQNLPYPVVRALLDFVYDNCDEVIGL